jgi:hypothetical protein
MTHRVPTPRDCRAAGGHHGVAISRGGTIHASREEMIEESGTLPVTAEFDVVVAASNCRWREDR